MKVSIIIPTINRPKNLEKCLKNLTINTNYKDYEIIIVDSSTSVNALKNNREIAEKFQARYVYEPRKGLSIARNTGIKNAKGDIIVFIDDDFIVARDWLKYIIRNYNDRNVMAVTGRMIDVVPNPLIKDILEQTLTFDRGNKKRIFCKKDLSLIKLLLAVKKIGKRHLGEYTPAPYGIGFGFCSFRKKVFEIVGLFDEKLGRGTPSQGGEDIDMYYRILKHGYKIVYEPKASVFHFHLFHSMKDLKDYSYKCGSSLAYFMKKYLHDPYVLALFIGYIVLSATSFVINIITRKEEHLNKVILLEFSSFLKNVLFNR